MDKISKVKIVDQLKRNQEIVLAKSETDFDQRTSLDNILYFSDKKNDAKGFKRRILVAENDNMIYTATNFTVNSRPFTSCSRYYVGILNKNSKKMKVLNTQMYDLRPDIIGNLFGEAKAAEKNKEINEREELTMAFGSLKKQRALEAKLRHQVGTENVTKLMDNVVQNVEINEPIKMELNDTQSNAMPPINRQAGNVESVYDMSDLIIFPPDLFDEWETSSLVFTNATTEDIKEWIKQKTYPSFVVNLLNKLPTQGQFRVEKCKTLMYMNYLYQVLQLNSAELRKGDFLKEVPVSIKDAIMTKFFQVSGAKGKRGTQYRVMTPKQRDSCLAYVIVLMLLYNNYSFDSMDLIPDLKISVFKFNMLVRAVGANIKKSTAKGLKVDMAVLSLPLTVLEVRHPKKKS